MNNQIKISRQIAILQNGQEQMYVLVTRTIHLGCGLSFEKQEFCFIPKFCNGRLPDRLGTIRFLNSDGGFSKFPKVLV